MHNNVIEHGIRPICDVLNAHPQITTRWSCEGHYTHSRPYVSFEAPLAIALKIHNGVQLAQRLDHLKYYWIVTASFQNENGAMQWLLALESNVSRWKYLPILRKGIDRELECLQQTLLKSINDYV